MGGFGSGQWSRWNSRTICESLRSLDIRDLRKKGLFSLESRIAIGTISWTRNGSPNGLLQYRADKSGIELRYSYLAGNKNDWVPVKEHISFQKTPCNYGDFRYWFTCPGCSRRMAKLYLLGHQFRCRRCHNLSHASQHEGHLDRMFRKTRKIRDRLGASGNLMESVLFRPKGMHQRTFDRLLAAEREAHAAVNRATAEKMGWVLGASN